MPGNEASSTSSRSQSQRHQLHNQFIPTYTVCSAHMHLILNKWLNDCNIVHVESASLGTGSASSCSSIDTKQTFCVSGVSTPKSSSHTLVSVGCTMSHQ